VEQNKKICKFCKKKFVKSTAASKVFCSKTCMQNQRYADGICKCCSNLLDSKSIRCKKCREKSNAYTIKKYAENIAKKACTQCSKKAAKNKQLCNKCSVKNNLRVKKEHAALIKINKCTSCRENPLSTKNLCRDCADKRSATMRKKNAAVRREVLIHYSLSDKPFCECCKIDKIEFLAIDHIDGGGVQHMKKIKTTNLAKWLKKNNYPDGYRVLCHNCNMSLGFYGYCPHGDTNDK
jgi:hypothetical protein